MKVLTATVQREIDRKPMLVHFDVEFDARNAPARAVERTVHVDSTRRDDLLATQQAWADQHRDDLADIAIEVDWSREFASE